MSAVTEPTPGASAPETADALRARARGRQLPRARARTSAVVRDVSFHVAQGESFGLVGESGCGKSTIALAMVRYLARNGRVSAGTIEIDGTDVLGLTRTSCASCVPGRCRWSTRSPAAR